MSGDLPVEEQVPVVDDDLELDEEDNEEWSLAERCTHFVGAAFFAVLYPFGATVTFVGAFLRNWLNSRPGGLIVAGLPAAIILALTAYLLLTSRTRSAGDLIVRYRVAAHEAELAGDMDAAALWLEKTLQLNPLHPEHRFHLAMAAAHAGQDERAWEIMTSLAPEGTLGFPPAHYWMARELLEQSQPLTPETARRAEHHLLQSLNDNENQAQAHANLGQLYLKRNDFDRAVIHLQRAAPARPDLWFLLAQALRAAGRAADAHEPAAKARDYFRQQTQENPLVSDYRRGWAFAEQLLGNHQEAVQILEGGLDSAEAQLFHQSLVEVYINWHNAEIISGKATLARQLELLSRFLEHGPNDPRLLTLLAQLALQDWERADEAFATLKELVARGVAPATVHLIIGTQSLKKGNLQDAKTHLQLANDQNPDTAATLNNLAWLLANQDKPDLEQALQLGEHALKLSDRPEIHDTVGTILARMGRSREAVAELEVALRGLPDEPELHFKLADAYEELGEDDLARIHRRLADGQSPSR